MTLDCEKGSQSQDQESSTERSLLNAFSKKGVSRVGDRNFSTQGVAKEPTPSDSTNLTLVMTLLD